MESDRGHDFEQGANKQRKMVPALPFRIKGDPCIHVFQRPGLNATAPLGRHGRAVFIQGLKSLLTVQEIFGFMEKVILTG